MAHSEVGHESPGRSGADNRGWRFIQVPDGTCGPFGPHAASDYQKLAALKEHVSEGSFSSFPPPAHFDAAKELVRLDTHWKHNAGHAILFVHTRHDSI
jgi:hypothetical protein